MLTRTQSKILHAAIDISHNGVSTMNWYDISEKIHVQPVIVFAAVKVLVKKELLEYVYDSGTNTPNGFKLTSYSINLKEYNIMRVKIFLINNLIAIFALIIAIIALFLPAN